ncbi:MAG TPA: histidine kinase dimerization/phospho-acceptor domain-containing protein [Streptosporangiaceae bacterium]|nr:histidine kinase dimerization/phospho-acceptor domain-containing protein [Streptosporangiaceae bacterium]
MNALLDRLQLALERQRDFVADASHELLTPLTALRAELELASRRRIRVTGRRVAPASSQAPSPATATAAGPAATMTARARDWAASATAVLAPAATITGRELSRPGKASTRTLSPSIEVLNVTVPPAARRSHSPVTSGSCPLPAEEYSTVPCGASTCDSASAVGNSP